MCCTQRCRPLSAMARALCETRDVLNRIIAITPAIETINGMAKTAPMTDTAMAKVIEAAKIKS
jgi:hypothetical protein